MEGMQPMIDTALPFGIGQAPIFRSFGPQKMAGGEGNELGAAPDDQLGSQVGDVALHGLGRQVQAGRDVPGGATFGQQRQHFGLAWRHPRRGQGVVLEVSQTDPGLRGDTASGGGTKPATLETGATVQVPLFVDIGDKVKVDTRSGEYMSRA